MLKILERYEEEDVSLERNSSVSKSRPKASKRAEDSYFGTLHQL